MQTQLAEALKVLYRSRNALQAYADVSASNQVECHLLLLKVYGNIGLLGSAMSNCKANPVVSSCQVETRTKGGI